MVAKVSEYCLDDSRDLINLHRYICQAEFYLTQIVPMNYQRMLYSGSVGRINNLMFRDYLYNSTSIPVWSKDKLYIEGASVEADEAGLFKYVGDSDITSMYPNLMINYDIFPKSDTLQTMRRTLIDLKDSRIALKRQMKSTDVGLEKNRLNGMQNAMKILINCFHPDTNVLTNNGYECIEDVEIGDIVQSINPETLELEWKPVIAKERKQKGAKMLEFITNIGKKFKVTDGHNLATFDKYNLKHNLSKSKLIKQEAKDFKVGDAIPIPVKTQDTSLLYNNDAYCTILPYMNHDDIYLTIVPKIYGRIFKCKYNLNFFNKMKYDGNKRAYKIKTSELTMNDKFEILKIDESDADIYLKQFHGKNTPIRFLLSDFMK